MPEGGTKLTLNPAALAAAFQSPEELYSPGIPPNPVVMRPTRRFDFPTGVNLQYTPRAYEPFGFHQLRSFSNVELIRLAIETRKDQMVRLDWQIRTKIHRKPRSDSDERIAAVTKLFCKPDGTTPFDSWLRLIAEDLLSIDAVTLERRRNRSGKLIGLDVVDGSTIKVLIDEYGRTPPNPLPAYQQVIKGVIWNELSQSDIIYAPRNPRPGHMYGFGPVEQTIVTINTLMRRQAQQLAWFTEGNVPAGILSLPDGWTPEQLAEFQTWLDSILSGNTANRAKLIGVPNGTKYQAFKDSIIKDEFDEWLARIVCYAFSIPPTPFIKQMNRGTAQEDQDRAIEEGLSPILVWAKRLFDSVIREDLGMNDLEFAWITERDLDQEKQARIADILLRNGAKTINEVRDDLGLPTMGPSGDKHYVYVGNGAIPVDTLEEQADASIDQMEASAEASRQPKPAAGGQGAKPTTGKSQKPAATSSSPSPQRKTPQTQ